VFYSKLDHQLLPFLSIGQKLWKRNTNAHFNHTFPEETTFYLRLDISGSHFVRTDFNLGVTVELVDVSKQ